MDDLVSRQAAIDAVHEEFDECLVWDESGEYTADEVERILDRVPSAQPEWKKGRWIRNDNGTYSCSVCQSWIPEEQYFYARYCLCRGADMRGEQP